MSSRVVRWNQVWRFPAAGFAAAMVAAVWPGSPWGPAGWPARGPFGAFTWTSWFVSAGLAATLGLLAVALAARGGRTGRAVSAALAFALIAGSAYLAAARVDEIRRNPAAALVVALAGLIVMRAVASRIVLVETGPGADVAD